ncbi:Rz1-like lysis system protein LysC [Yersinia enterocolitica]|uniref:Rz1-like lysis system protein LysC n=1 Tax=Yersinia enterocolitica TaxID=630 RepID=UPI003E0F37EE
MNKSSNYNKYWPMTHVLKNFCLILLLSSCAQTEWIPTSNFPADSLLISCHKSLFTGQTWHDSLAYTLALKQDLDICASRMDKLIKWHVHQLESPLSRHQ